MAYSIRKTGKYYYEGLKEGKKGKLYRKPSKNFDNFDEAYKNAKKEQNEGKILQATFYLTKNALTDVDIAGLDTKGHTKYFNKETNKFLYYSPYYKTFV